MSHPLFDFADPKTPIFNSIWRFVDKTTRLVFDYLKWVAICSALIYVGHDKHVPIVEQVGYGAFWLLMLWTVMAIVFMMPVPTLIKNNHYAFTIEFFGRLMMMCGLGLMIYISVKAIMAVQSH